MCLQGHISTKSNLTLTVPRSALLSRKSQVVRALSEGQPALIHWMWTCAPLQGLLESKLTLQ